MENQIIPTDFDYSIIVSLSNESKQKLINVRPETLGQASRIDGVRSSDISLLCIKIKQYNYDFNSEYMSIISSLFGKMA